MKPTMKIRVGLAALVFSLTLVASSAVAIAAPTFNRPVNESTHAANAIALSTTAYPSGAPAAVVTSVDSYADSLSAAVLARAYSGPLLLTSGSGLSANVASELTRLHPAKVFLVGLPSTMVPSVTGAVAGLTADSVSVIKGADRYETAALVARAVGQKTGTVSRVVIAPGDSYGAALAASSLAAAQRWPLILMPKAGPLPASAREVIGALGVSSGLEVGTEALVDISGFTVTKRIVGTASATDSDGRYDTAAKLAGCAVEQGWLSYSHVGIVSGEDYPDGEIAASYLSRDRGVLLLSNSAALQAATSAALRSNGRAVGKVDVVGLGWAVYREVKALNSPRVTALGTTKGATSGGNRLVITGTNLDKATRVRVGKVDVAATNWRADSATQLTISSVPAGYGDGPVEVIVTDYWGPSPASTRDLYWYGSGEASTAGEKVVKKAVEYLGVPYLWAGSSPTTGMDCSGFCMYVYKQFGISLPHSSKSMATLGTAVAKTDLRPGDLVFFYSPISHVGMYVGGGLMINSPRSGDLVCIEDAFRSGYVTARRFVSSGPATTHFEQSDTRLAYSGSWSTSTTSLASGGNFAYSDTKGSSVTIAFNGTLLGLIAKKSPQYGIAKVTLDGGTPQMVDLYNSSTVYLQKVWSTGALVSGSHKIVIEWTGAKNASATGHNIGIDAVDVVGSLTQASATTGSTGGSGTAVRYEQTDSHLGWAGDWKTFSTTGPSSGSYLRACTSGASATIAFKGTYLGWIATKGTTLGKAQVRVDGGAPVTVDLAASAVAYQQKVWETGTLANADHRVTISWDTGNAVGKYISVDAVEVKGTLNTATNSSTSIAPTGPAPIRCEQSDGHVVYSGPWVTSSSASASGGSFRYSDASGSSVKVTFVGSYLAWIAKKSPKYGLARVTLDGGTPVTVDLYNSSEVFKQKVWQTAQLVLGTHTVVIQWTGTKNARATDCNIGVDAFDVVGTLK